MVVINRFCGGIAPYNHISALGGNKWSLNSFCHFTIWNGESVLTDSEGGWATGLVRKTIKIEKGNICVWCTIGEKMVVTLNIVAH